MAEKILATNRRARFDYTLLDTYTAGLVLHGYETKSIRAGQIDLKQAFVTMKDNEAWLTNAHVRRYQHAGSLKEYDPVRSRKLLLSRRELAKLAEAKHSKLTIIPLKVVLKGPYIKLVIATAQGKKKYDKRSAKRAEDARREAEKAVKSRSRTRPA